MTSPNVNSELLFQSFYPNLKRFVTITPIKINFWLCSVLWI